MSERVPGICPVCGRGVYLVPGDHTMCGGPPTCPGSHIRLVEFYKDFDELPEWLQVQIEQVRAEGENAGLEKAAVIVQSVAPRLDVIKLAVERIRAAKSTPVGSEPRGKES